MSQALRFPAGPRLRQLREQAGESRAELQLAFNVTEQTINDWERGRQRPRRDALVKLASRFGVPLDELAALDDPVDSLIRQREEQGLVRTVEDPAALERVAGIFKAS